MCVNLSFQACRYGHVQHLEHLLFYGADMSAQNASGNTALHVCALYNQVPVILNMYSWILGLYEEWHINAYSKYSQPSSLKLMKKRWCFNVWVVVVGVSFCVNCSIYV